MVSDPRISYALPLLVAAWLVTVGSVAMHTACAEPVDGAKKLLVVDEPLGIAGYFSVVAAGLVAVVRYGCGGSRRACFLAIAGLALCSSASTGAADPAGRQALLDSGEGRAMRNGLEDMQDLRFTSIDEY